MSSNVAIIAALGDNAMAHSKEQKTKIVTAICQNYAEVTEDGRRSSWEACIEAQGISKPTFYQWVSDSNEFNTLFKKAKEDRAQTERAVMLHVSRGVLMDRIINGEKKTRIEINKDKEGNLLSSKEITETTPCNIAALIFVNKSLDPAFAENKPAGNEAEAALAQAVDPSVLFKKALSKEDKEDATSEQTPQTA